MEKLNHLKKGVSTTFKRHPVLSVLSLVCSLYIASLIVLAVIVTIAPQSEIGMVVDSIF